MAEEDYIRVSPAVFSAQAQSLKNKVRRLEQAAAAIRSNLVRCNREFDDVNFRAAEKIVDGVQQRLTEAGQKLEKLLKFLSLLEKRAEEYLKCGFER